ncbi:MAG TPA: aminotransferase class IV [Egibacteraceae bacterium]|nr:aminotransferase class IV [Egibacteraceae bacterium]
MALDSALIDGKRLPLAEATLPVTDEGVARGDGAFETVGVWGGRPFRPDAHLARLAASLAAIGLPAADTAVLRREMGELLEGVDGDAALRVYATGSGTRVLTLTAQPSRLPARHLVPQPAPWIRPLGTYGPAGAKTMSYMPNMAATRAAQAAGGDDALLVSLEGVVLEGPTFCVLWVRDGVVHTPAVDLGVVDSVSRRALVELAVEAGLDAVEGRWKLDELAGASEFLVCSSVRPLIAARLVGDLELPDDAPVRDRLGAALDARRRGG